jgi:hypothetical protein
MVFGWRIATCRSVATITVATGGAYTVEVSNAFGCQRTRTVQVYVSEIATIRNIKINDLTDTNTIQVVVDGSRRLCL